MSQRHDRIVPSCGGVLDQSVWYRSVNIPLCPLGVVTTIDPPSPSRESALGPIEELIDALSADFFQALDAVQVPAYIVDSDRRLRWQNAASIAVLGDLRGKIDRSIVVAEDVPRVREAFVRKQMGALHTELDVTVVRPDGSHVHVAVSSVPLKDKNGKMIGSFGITRILGEVDSPPGEDAPRLTARQHQVLTLLAGGYSTAQMADVMGLSKHTVRNHVKRLLQSLDARSRVEAVAKGRLANLI